MVLVRMLDVRNRSNRLAFLPCISSFAWRYCHSAVSCTPNKREITVNQKDDRFVAKSRRKKITDIYMYVYIPFLYNTIVSMIVWRVLNIFRTALKGLTFRVTVVRSFGTIRISVRRKTKRMKRSHVQ